MSLGAGARLGHYSVTAKLGEGGMGEVWRATDTQLNRDVALKILPDAFASDPDCLARFQREAQVLASLNHPGIAAIYGIEKSDGAQALVLELVEGPTLADRIARGPIPRRFEGFGDLLGDGEGFVDGKKATLLARGEGGFRLGAAPSTRSTRQRMDDCRHRQILRRHVADASPPTLIAARLVGSHSSSDSVSSASTWGTSRSPAASK